jgi:four helix bundle protein
MATIISFRDLEVWQAAMELTVVIYGLTDRFPTDEKFGLTSQMRRSAVSIASNVAEDHNRRTNRPYRNHVLIALGSQGELDTLVELALRLRFITSEDVSGCLQLITRVGQMLSGLARSLKADDDED